MDTRTHPEIPPAAAAAARGTPLRSLLMAGLAQRLAGALALAVLLWLCVAWAMDGTGGPAA